jgi:hypothetical protein
MDRRVAIGALVAAALCLAGWAGFQARAGEGDKGHAQRHSTKCAKASADCQLKCEENFHHCAELVAQGKKDHAAAMYLSLDCAELCATTARLTGRQSPLALIACEACAKACDACAAACEKHGQDEHMKACAAACRACARECRTTITHLGHDHGGK